ncbi:tetratricopeptide repeat protein, partial [Verrucomicrobiota bacterium]
MRAMRQRTIFPAVMTLLLLSSMSAVSADFDELAQMGEDALTAGKYDEAIKYYEKITATGKTYINILSVRFDLAWCYYLTGQPDKAIPLFESLSGNRSPSESVKQQSMFLLAECHARLASMQEEKPAARKKNLEKALKLHTEFQKKYPKNPNIPQSYYGRAYAYYLDRQLEKAAADLQTVITKYPGTPTVKDATYLLASVYSEQALDKLKAGDKEASKGYINKARELFDGLSKGKGVNLALANDSYFSLAETWFAAGEYLEAIRYYQQMRSKAEVVRNIRKLREQVEQQFMEALRKKEDTTVTRAAMDKLKVQIRDVSKAPNMMISGYFKIADAFYRLERYDETRAVSRHLLNFTEDEQKQQAYYLLITSYLKEENADAAAREFESFQEIFGVDVPMADTVSLSIGQLYMQ